MLTIVKDKDLIWDVEEYDVILVATNIYNMLSDGFQRKMKKKYPILDDENNKGAYADVSRLGKRHVVDSIKPVVCLCYISKYKMPNRTYMDYDALENCMMACNVEFKGKKVACTVMGHSYHEGGGDKERIMEILEKYSDRLDLYVYDYEQICVSEERSRVLRYIFSFKDTDNEKFKLMLKSMDETNRKFYIN